MSTLPSREERKEFLESRREGVGGSDVAAICGLDPYRSPLDIYLDKVRGADPGEVDSIHLLRGQLLEDVFAELYCEESGRDVRRMGQRVHPEYDWARVNVDRQILSPDDGDTGALEIKSPGREAFQNLIEAGLPERYLVQVQWEMFVPDYGWASFAAGNLEHSGGPLIYFDIERNDLLIEQLLARVEQFWTEHVVPRRPPEPEEWVDDPPEVPDTSGDRVVVEDEAIQAEIARLMDAYEARKRAKEEYEAQKERVQEILDEAGIQKLQVPGVGKVNYTHREGRTRFKDDLLRKYGALDPDAVERFLREESLLVNPALDDDPDALDRLLEELTERCQLDLSLFEKQSNPYRYFRPYPASDRNEE